MIAPMHLGRLFTHLVVAWCWQVVGTVSPAAAPPNVVMLFSDDQRHDTIHALGNRDIQTPNLDRLVQRGTAFTHAFIMGGGQGAICMPSRAMLMTGCALFRATSTFTGNVIPPALTTWPQTLREEGYDAIGIGTWHNDRPSYARLFNGGGPVFFGGMSDHEQVVVHEFQPSGQYTKATEHITNKFSSELWADAAVAFLKARRSEKPFFLYVAFTAPHDPRTPPAEYVRRYPPAKIPLPKNFLPEHPFDNGELKVRDEKLLPWPRTPDAVKNEIALYYGMITHLDAQIGRILTTLESSGLGTNTLIVFAGDNGLAVGQHGLVGKQNLYEHSIRVPLVMAGPGIPKNRRSDALCYLFDVYPTVCELAGIEAPGGLDGRSLVPVIQGRQKKIRDDIFAAFREVQRTLRDERWKLICYPRINRCQLFDLERDPWEMRDLASEPKHAARVAAMQARLAVRQAEFHDLLAAPR